MLGVGNSCSCETHRQIASFFPPSASVSLFVTCAREFLRTFSILQNISTSYRYCGSVTYSSDCTRLRSTTFSIFQEFDVNRKCRNNTNSWHLVSIATRSGIVSSTLHTFTFSFDHSNIWLTKFCKINIILIALQIRPLRLPHPVLHVHRLVKKKKEKWKIQHCHCNSSQHHSLVA